MNPSIPPHSDLNNRDLIELAQLDALGLLDENERQMFERAFKAAPTSIQQIVRDTQARTSQIDAWLPDVQPPVSLRERVLNAVAAAIRSDSRQPQVAGRLTPAIARSSTVSPFWRAAAIGSMAAAVLFGVVTLKLYGDFQTVNSNIQSNAVADKFLKDFGPRFEHMLTSGNTQFVQFDAATTEASGSAVALLDPESETGHFLAKDLPPVDEGYTLALIDPAGNVVRTIAVINAQSSRVVTKLTDVKLAPGQSIALQTAGQKQTVLKGRNL